MSSSQRVAIPLALVVCAWGFASSSITAVAAAPPTEAVAVAEESLEPGEPEQVDLRAVASDDALELDVLAVTSLPFAADEAREAGVDAAEVADVIGAVVDVGASPAVATDLLVAESEQAKKRGNKPHFAGWVRGQLASGKHSRQLVAMIEKREAEYIELTSAERARLDAKIGKLRAEAIQRRQADAMELAALVKSGKQLRTAGTARFQQLRQRVMASVARQQRIERELATDPRKREELERALKRVEQAAAKTGRTLERARREAVRNEEGQR